MEKDFTILKTDDKRLVFGWASIALTVDGEQLEDRQQDMIDPEDLEEAVYEYVLKFRDTGEEHLPGYRKKGKLVESCVFTAEKQKAMGIPEGTLPVGWWIGFKIEDDDAWERVKNGTYRMFSIEGRANREPVEKAKKPGCGVLVVKDGKILTGTRLETRTKGQICGPGGHIEAGETPEEAAIREAYEEFGIVCRNLEPMGALDEETPALFMCTDYSGTPRTDEEEITDLKWRTPKDLQEEKLFAPFAASLELLPQRTAKSFTEILKFNPYHGYHGYFSSANGATSMTVRTKDPNKQHWADMAVARAKEGAAGGGKPSSGEADLDKLRGHVAEADDHTLMNAWQKTKEDTSTDGIVLNSGIETELERRGKIFMNNDTFEYETLNTGGERKMVEGKDIVESIELEHAADMHGATFDDVLMKQGFKDKPQVVSAEEFDKAVEESGIIGYRTINAGNDVVSGEERTAGQFAELMKHGEPEQVSLNGFGAKAFGDGLYVATNRHVTPGRKPNADDADAAKSDSLNYGWNDPATVACTLSPKAKRIVDTDLFNEFMKLPESTQKAFGWNKNAYAAAKGYDAVLVEWGGCWCDYTIVLNRSALIFREGFEELA